jgi:hypothetical protein
LNRLRVQRQWFWSYWTGQRGSRLISEAPRSRHFGRHLVAGPTAANEGTTEGAGKGSAADIVQGVH